MSWDDPYAGDVLGAGWKQRGAVQVQIVPAERGLVVEDLASGFTGAIVRADAHGIELEDYFGKRRVLPFTSQYLVEGKPVRFRMPDAAPGARKRTASGSFAVESRARVARASRILVEGRHDAELVERVWGDDLRVEGVVVEYLGGIDDLAELLGDYRPDAQKRIGVLVDHLVPGSKEQRIADAVMRGPFGPHVRVVGHPFVDVWQAVKPERLGIRAWPTIPRSMEWKKGVCKAFGWPHETQTDTARAWQRILSRVRTYADLEPALLGRVEELIDFVTEPGSR